MSDIRKAFNKRLKYVLPLCAVFILGCEQPADENKFHLNTKDKLLIQCGTQCAQVKSGINGFGGEVTHEYNNIGALAVTIPAASSSELNRIPGIISLGKDNKINNPVPQNKTVINNSANAATRPLSRNQLQSVIAQRPLNYSYNNVQIGVADLHAQELFGDGVVVAVIDSGIANNSDIVPTIAGNVIGGESFVELPDEPSATSTLNDSHGTMVANMIAAHAGLYLDNSEDLVVSLSQHAPDSVIPDENDTSIIPLVGTAPGASLYSMKVFPADGSGAFSSDVISALDRVLTLKRNFNNGMPSEAVAGDGSEENPFVYDSLNIQVVNLSLGGISMFPGYELDDLLVLEMLKEGITVVSAVGNEGFAAMTGGSPGTSVASLTVGAISDPVHERVFVDLTWGLGFGELFRPNDSLQPAYFSSRGPTADGRAGLQILANGDFSFVQGADGSLALVSGTSFSSPTIAGTAALLWQAAPESAATEIRDALIRTANHEMYFDEKPDEINRGKGLANVVAAYDAVISGNVDNETPELPDAGKRPSKVKDNIEELDIKSIELEDDEYIKEVSLEPGQVEHFFIESSLETAQFHIDISAVTPQLPPEQQNQLFGDALMVTVIDAPTSYNENFWIDSPIDRLTGDNQYTIENPQTGIIRLAVMGDWTNVGAISAKITLSESRRRVNRPYASGTLTDEEVDEFKLQVPESTTQLNFELWWKSDWGRYPAHDIDLIIFDPSGVPYIEGASLAVPERVTIDGPQPGEWTMMVTGYMLHGLEDQYYLRISDQDNKPLRRGRGDRNHRDN